MITIDAGVLEYFAQIQDTFLYLIPVGSFNFPKEHIVHNTEALLKVSAK